MSEADGGNQLSVFICNEVSGGSGPFFETAMADCACS